MDQYEFIYRRNIKKLRTLYPIFLIGFIQFISISGTMLDLRIKLISIAVFIITSAIYLPNFFRLSKCPKCKKKIFYVIHYCSNCGVLLKSPKKKQTFELYCILPNPQNSPNPSSLNIIIYPNSLQPLPLVHLSPGMIHVFPRSLISTIDKLAPIPGIFFHISFYILPRLKSESMSKLARLCNLWRGVDYRGQLI